MSKQIFFLAGILLLLSVSCKQDVQKKVSRDGSPADKIILKVTHNGKDKHPFQTGFLKFKEVLEAETNGVVEVQIFPNEQLGNEEETSQMVKMGLISGAAVGTGGLGNVIPEVDLFNLPFIFNDLDHFYRVVDGPVGKRVAASIEEEMDCIVLGYWFSGIRNAWNSSRPIMTPDDFTGLKIRCMPGSPILVETFNALGAQATPMSYGQLYSALQMGVVDGAETDHVDLLLDRLYEVTKYVSYTNHTFLGVALIFSKKQYNKLPPEYREIVIRAGKAAIQAERDEMESMTRDALVELEKLGLEFHEVDKDPFREKVQSVYNKYSDKVGGLEIIDEVGRQ
jgi:TRAP-type transport system periplasmic protein